MQPQSTPSSQPTRQAIRWAVRSPPGTLALPTTQPQTQQQLHAAQPCREFGHLWGLIWQVPNAAASVFKPGPFAFTLPPNAPKLPTPRPPAAPPALPRPMWARVRCVLNRGARSASTVARLGPLLPQKPTKAWPRAVDKSIATAAGGAAVLGTNPNARELAAEAGAYDVVAVFVEQ